MEFLLSPQAWLTALGIFTLRIGDMTLDTIRVLFVMRGRRRQAWILGLLQSSIFVLAISSVLTNLDNPLNIIGYATGFATGNVVGMYLEERMAIGYIQLTVISSLRGAAIIDEMRKNGYAVTEIPARGKNGTVSVLHVGVLRKDIDNAETIIMETDPEAFITIEDVRSVRRGFWRA